MRGREPAQAGDARVPESARSELLVSIGHSALIGGNLQARHEEILTGVLAGGLGLSIRTLLRGQQDRRSDLQDQPYQTYLPYYSED